MPGKQWWTVEVYLTEDLTSEDRRKLSEQADNAAPYEDGIILQNILLSQQLKDVGSKVYWDGQLKDTKPRDVECLLKFPQIEEKLMKLVGLPGLWLGIKLGSLHSVSLYDLVPVSISGDS